MRWVVRGLFVFLLILALMAQAARMTRSDAQLDGDADLIHRLARLDPPVSTTTGSETLTATVADCSEPVTIARMDVDGLGNETVHALLTTAVVPRYAYLGSVGDSIDRVGILARWATASALTAFGLRRGDVPSDVVVILLPKACPQLTDLDWAVLSPWSG